MINISHHREAPSVIPTYIYNWHFPVHFLQFVAYILLHSIPLTFFLSLLCSCFWGRLVLLDHRWLTLFHHWRHAAYFNYYGTQTTRNRLNLEPGACCCTVPWFNEDSSRFIGLLFHHYCTLFSPSKIPWTEFEYGYFQDESNHYLWFINIVCV
jgi:hypothetical protein